MIHEVRGQEDITVNIAAPGDKTLSLAVSGSHVQIVNKDPVQQIMYAIVAAPVFPVGWRVLGVGSSIVEDMAGGVLLHLRKKRYIRFVGAGERYAAGAAFPGDDVSAQVEVSDITY